MILPKVRDPRLVTIRRGGTLSDDHHRLLALWAATCAEHVLQLFESQRPDDPRPRQAIEHARAWVRGEVPMMRARAAGGHAMGAARDLSGAARHAAYAAGQAGAVAHVAEHDLGAAAYAIKAALRLTRPTPMPDDGSAGGSAPSYRTPSASWSWTTSVAATTSAGRCSTADRDTGLVKQPRVLELNGGSSSGKSTLARRLQLVLDGYWLRLGVDTLLDAAPPRLLEAGGLVLADDGGVVSGERFVEVEGYWMAGVAAVARAGGQVIVEDNFVSGPVAQDRWRDALVDLPVGWVGVRCSAEVAARREAARGDRVGSMAALQAGAVHEGITYDLQVDTDVDADVAELVREHFFSG